MLTVVMLFAFGTVAVFASEAEETTVTTEAELNSALTNGGSIKLGADIQLTDGWTVGEGKEVVLDLAGNNLTVGKSESNALIYGKLTVKDTVGGGISTARNHFVYGELILESGTLQNISTNTAGFALNIEVGGKATINGGSVKAVNTANYAIRVLGSLEVNGGNHSGNHGVVSVSGTAVINNGTFTCLGVAGQTDNVIYVFSGSIVIYNGTFIADSDSTASGTCVCCDNVGTAVIENGTFSNSSGGDVWSEEGAAIINGGTFENLTQTAHVSTGAVITNKGETLVKNEDGTLAAADVAAKIGDTTYETLAEAITAAQAGETVTLLRDVTFSEILEINKSITLDGNGKTLTSSADRAINVTGANADGVTIKNLTIKASGERAINIIQKATNVTIDNVTATAYNYTVNVAPSAPNAIVTINNSTLTGLNVVNVASQNAQITVNGGTLVCNDQSAKENYAALALNNDAKGAVITATGVTFDIKGDSAEASDSTEDGKITINDIEQRKNAALIGGYSFKTLAEAIEYAKAGNVIKLIDNIVLDAGIVIGADKNITIDLNGKTISYVSNAVGEDMITNNGILTITGEGTITYNNTDTTGSNVTISTISNCGTLIINSGRIVNESSDDKAWMSGGIYPFTIDSLSGSRDATVIINGGEIVTNYRSLRAFCNSTTYKNTVEINGGTFVGQVWMQSSNANANLISLTITDGSFAPNSRDGSSVYITTSTKTEASVTGGTYATRIGVDNTANLSGFVSGGTFGKEFDEAILADGYVLESTANGYVPRKATLEDIITFKGYSISMTGDGVTAGYTVDTVLFEAYCKENGEINLGIVFAATKIDANAIYKSFEGLALTTNYNASLKDMKQEHLDRAFVMALYLEIGAEKKFVTASEGVTVLVDAANVEAITYNGVKAKEENK